MIYLMLLGPSLMFLMTQMTMWRLSTFNLLMFLITMLYLRPSELEKSSLWITKTIGKKINRCDRLF
jgi:hypothetical protein